MFAYMRGILAEKEPLYAVLDVSGIGYKIMIPPNTVSASVGEELTLWTSFVIRENAQTLYGFVDRSASEIFELLLSVSGIGPKTALGLLSRFSVTDLQQAVIEGDIYLLSKAPGIGEKTARRLVLDMKDRLSSFSPREPEGPDAKLKEDAVRALMNLGFPLAGAKKSVEKIIKEEGGTPDLSELIARALRKG